MSSRHSHAPTPSSSQPIWIDSDRALQSLVVTMVHQESIAVDTEFLRERTYYPKLALIQLAWPGACYLIDPFAVDLSSLAEAFESSTTTFVFHAFEQDLDILDRAVGTVPRNLFDTQIAAGFLGLTKASLVNLLERFCGITLPKADRLTDWTDRPLRQTQIDYAASDVLWLLDLKTTLTTELTKRERAQWAQEETDLAAAKRRLETPLDDVWLRIKECRGLTADARRYAQAVARWREQRARELDIPNRFILSDLSIAAIAQAKPRSLVELGAVRGVDLRRLGPGVDQELLEVVADARNSNITPKIPTYESVAPRGSGALISLCTAWVYAKAHHEEIDPALIGTRDDVTEFLFGSESRLKEGWRYDLIGSDLLAIKAGKKAVFVTKNGALALTSL
ncbi:MAG: ribonuclease D [Acidimicrobiales bacterium]